MKLKYLFVVLLVALFSCARRGSIGGGIKDENAPIIISAIPTHNATNFNTKEIRIYFDEYIKLNDLQEQLIISPPLKYNPIITPLGLPSKRLTIKISDTLKANTTYVFNFGESIEDNNEGNTLSNFKYVFSTGNYIDSLKIKGVIADAFSKETADYVSVLLYEINENYKDSIIFKEKPAYVANTLDSIAWEITNIKKGKYKIIALKENTKNYVYNPKHDQIAFLDSIITIPTTKNFTLKLFKQTPDFNLVKPLEVAKGHLIFGYQGNAKKLKATLLDNEFETASFFEKEKDTLHFFFKGKDLDSIKIKFENNNFNEEKFIKLRLKKTDSLIIKNTIRQTLFLNDTIKLLSNIPLSKIDDSKISLVDKDTVAIPFKTKIVTPQELKILFERKPENRYNLEILPNAITDFFNQTNDTLNYKFNTKKKTFYGGINLKVTTKSYPIIVQLLSDKSEIISEIYAKNEQDFIFDNLVPLKYTFRVIIDENKNKKWDSGNFINNKQPEKVYYYNKIIEVKENFFFGNEVFNID